MRILAGVAVAGLLVVAQAQATVAYNFPGTLVGNQTGGPYILGNDFVVNSAISVTAVGAFDSNLDGFGAETVPVALYQFSGGSWSQVSGTLASFSGTVGTLVGSARFQNLASPVTLTPGTYAIVAANYGAVDVSAWNASVGGGPPAPTFNNGGGLISMAGPNTAFYGSGSTLSGTLSGLTDGSWGSPTPAFAGGTFDFAPVPEAEDYAVIAVGLLGLVYIGRYARNQRTQKLA